MAIDPLPVVPQPEPTEPARTLRDYAPRDTYSGTNVDQSIIQTEQPKTVGYVASRVEESVWHASPSSRSPTSTFPQQGSSITKGNGSLSLSGAVTATVAAWDNGYVTNTTNTTFVARDFLVCVGGVPTTVRFLTLAT
jgi:hypothetical protein